MKVLDHEIIRTSAFVRSYISGQEPAAGRFPHRELTQEFCRLRASQGASRSRLGALVTSSMSPRELSSQQQSSLTALSEPDSVVAVTGQQVGMMGGPMYTLYKIRTAVAVSRTLGRMHGIKAIPVFWLEDNDHDAAEASQLTLPGADSTPSVLQTWDGQHPRTPVSMLRVDAGMHARIADASALLAGQHAETVRRQLLEAWSTDALWGDAFLTTLAPYLERWGVLVVRASEVIRSGMHAPLLMREVGSRTITTALQLGTQTCRQNGISIQAQPADFGFFVIDDLTRRRPDPSEPGLLERAQTRPQEFSPSVLTRPLIQDALLPTVVSVLGGAELAYHAQLAEAYQACGIEMPVPMLRHGATLLSPKIQRLLAKSETDAESYLQPWSEIERRLTQQLTQDVFPDADARQAAVDLLLAPYADAAAGTDVTLLPTVAAQKAGILASIDVIEGKIRSAIKRRNAADLDRARSLHSGLYPQDTLQERVYPLAYWEAQVGTDALADALEVFDAVASGHHLLVDLNPESSHS
jgi:bacillithiol synthase